jgi:phosphinothricin acetyltransferase
VDRSASDGASLHRVATAAIRPAAPADVDAIAAIYAHHVLTGLATFETEPPSPDEMRRRWREITGQGFPCLVAESDGEVLGYAYAWTYRPRPAYRYTVEDSIYLGPGLAGKGLGRRLLAALVDECTRLGFRQMVAVIGDSDNAGSIGVHRALGFVWTGRLDAVGFKFGRWVDSVVMQRALGEGGDTLPAEVSRTTGEPGGRAADEHATGRPAQSNPEG